MSKSIPTPHLQCVTGAKNAEAEVVVVFQDGDKKPIAPGGSYQTLVQRFRKGGAFSASVKSVEFVRFGGKGKAENVLLAGLGKIADLSPEKARQAGAVSYNRLAADKAESIAVNVDSFVEAEDKLPGSLSVRELVRAFAEGMVLASYKYRLRSDGSGKFDKPEKSMPTITFIAPNKALEEQVKEDLEWVESVGETVGVCREWSNLPQNIGTPEYFANQAKKLATQYGLKCRVLTERDAAREKMNLFLAVGQGSEREGRIVVLEYNPKGSKGKTVALVGKGITFDSGGISLKPSAKMDEMKHDMTGAATMMGAVLLAAKMRVPNKVVAILAFTENMPSGNAITPGVVIKSRAGKTVEITNTDAEGRLILADVLDYAHDFDPDIIIDAATLTGAVSVALGKHCCGILGNDQQLIEGIKTAGEQNGERLWQLPLFDEYFDDMKSEFADMNNVGPNGYGGTIRGAIFLKQFIKKDMPWAHLDIAATAWDLGHLPYCSKRGASGSYVRTLAQFISNFRG